MLSTALAIVLCKKAKFYMALPMVGCLPHGRLYGKRLPAQQKLLLYPLRHRQVTITSCTGHGALTRSTLQSPGWTTGAQQGGMPGLLASRHVFFKQPLTSTLLLLPACAVHMPTLLRLPILQGC